MISKERFVELIYNTESIFQSLDIDDLQGMYVKLGMPISSDYLISDVKKRLEELIAETLASEIREEQTSIDHLRSEIIFWGLSERKDVRHYVRIADALRYRPGTVPSEITDQQLKAVITYAKAYIDLETDKYDASINENYSKERFQFESSQLLSRYGCPVEIRDGKLQIKNADLRGVIDLVRGKIARWGGIPFVRRIFKLLRTDGLFDRHSGRYLMYTPNMYDPRNYKAARPIGYFLNIVSQFPYERNIEKRLEQEFDKDFFFIENILTAILSVEDCQQTSIWGTTFLKLENLAKFVIDSAIFDASIQFPQGLLSDEISSLPVLFSWVCKCP